VGKSETNREVVSVEHIILLFADQPSLWAKHVRIRTPDCLVGVGNPGINTDDALHVQQSA
jgi:hypothetical protein